ncbi:transglycosylase SLT domain-containing protein [Gallaecimonas kandeliae]|uniref:transglycosylase SLT domain-containing protein n=1 Tax=Gallaecimonas kandeliae TaxID=3029055 RepID=UPI002648FCFB|nr:transglycosylase SLT domain-containing protein [Gallaecimonas kandeliae]WKE65058.1 transglycosylase SLT domain-containing protein [Gallaecimonas kandeliae]
MKRLLLCLTLLLTACGPLVPAQGSALEPAQDLGTLPAAALKYQHLLLRSAQANWGLDAPVALLAAQVHQESRWRPDAESPVGAQGLAQFMPATAAWMAELYAEPLGANQPQDPAWALQALVLYDRWLYLRIEAASTCQQLAMTLAAYNGGLTWVRRDQALAAGAGADPGTWFGSVEAYTQRSESARRENRAYVQQIVRRWQPLYQSWGPAACEGKF